MSQPTSEHEQNRLGAQKVSEYLGELTSRHVELEHEKNLAKITSPSDILTNADPIYGLLMCQLSLKKRDFKNVMQQYPLEGQHTLIERALEPHRMQMEESLEILRNTTREAKAEPDKGIDIDDGSTAQALIKLLTLQFAAHDDFLRIAKEEEAK